MTQASHRLRRHPAWAGLLALGLAGCAADGSSPLARFQPSTNPAAAEAGSPSATGSAASAGTRPGGSRPVSAAASAAASGQSLKIGNKAIDPAAVVLDPTCETLVEPFELSDNFSELSSLTMGLLAENAAAMAGNSLQKATGQAVAPEKDIKLRHNLSATTRRAAVRMNWLPMTMEVMYGEHLLSEMKGSLLPRTGRIGPALYAKADALLAEVMASVTEPHAYRFQMYISSQAGDNAMALPGGLIVIDKALLEKPELRNKAYFALSHEVAHVLQRHETRAVQARVIDAVSLSKAKPDLVKTLHQANREPAAVVALVLAGKLLFEKHFENQELQSDACAVRLLDRTLKDKRRVHAAIQAFVDGLAPTAKPGRPGQPARGAGPVAPVGAAALAAPGTANAAGDLVELVSRPIERHPSTEARIANLNTMLRAIDPPASRAPGGPAAATPAARPAALRAAVPAAGAASGPAARQR